ncbi:DUF4097 family beta strand repeat-containing protein [Ureibacillus chungkukjangi]|uniref:DUF4097 family beta strand repeat-containing protein n=1 Tax=Ureibacillus chungkukjangi TaxID=1202712 RepID=UPI00203A4A37|nr:DUF4097 family beta strand repeat-containing protein [Ureibacillus chungkukjangi]MCM3389748.1 DUF4097 family beta strand repeat-containing protein [Ureibacillus chungkukjangi]
MENERKRILKLVENGTISAEEAIVLLEALTKEQNSTQPTIVPLTKSTVEEAKATQEHSGASQQQTTEEKKSKATGFEDIFGKAFNNTDTNKKMDEFMNDLKQDLSQFSERVMGLMNTTFTKIKDFDLEFPFGEKVQFDKTYTFDAHAVKGIEIDLPNGKVDLVKSDGQQILVETQVKTSIIDHDEVKTKAQFEEKFVNLTNDKLTISVSTKLSQVSLRLVVPEKLYDLLLIRLLNGSVTIQNLESKLLKVKTYNGAIKVDQVSFQHANIETGNGSIDLRNVKGEDLEAETVNGRIYIDGELQEVEAESVNGAVVITTNAKDARKVKAQTVAGAVELYVPKSISLDGQVATNFGKADIGLPDVETRLEEDQFFLKTYHFDKIIDDANILKLNGESRTGAIVVRYIAE